MSLPPSQWFGFAGPLQLASLFGVDPGFPHLPPAARKVTAGAEACGTLKTLLAVKIPNGLGRKIGGVGGALTRSQLLRAAVQQKDVRPEPTFCFVSRHASGGATKANIELRLGKRWDLGAKPPAARREGCKDTPASDGR